MVFASLTFIFLVLPLFWTLDFIFKKKIFLRNFALCAVSLFFYVFGGGTHCLKILIAYGVLNYIFGLILERQKSSTSIHKDLYQKLYLITFVSINLLALFFYKYAYWLISSFETMVLGFTNDEVTVSPKMLPLGISFFTFHAISYLIDISRGELSGKNKVLSFLTYFFMFPHLVAGPIVRFKQVREDLETRTPNSSLFTYGMYRFLLGFNKKILIANTVSVFPDMAFTYNIESISMGNSWLGAIGYALQIYFDFSAYSDMAIGLAAMAGFRFEENFNQPYLTKSIREFWRRWHISLSSWLRDYLYIPLGGSRVRTSRIYLNLITVFFFCGLWHGANMTFVIWGLYNGLFIILERLYLAKFFDKLPTIFSHIYAIIVILVGWVFFRAENLPQALDYISIMFGAQNFSNPFINDIEILNYVAMAIGIFVVFSKFKSFNSSNSHVHETHTIAFVVNAVLAFFSVAMLFNGSANPFIYFNF